MYYEIYIDVFFIENFLVDTMLLVTLKKIMMLQGSYLRVIAGGIVGAAFSSVCICIHMNIVLKCMLLYVVVPVIMLAVSYKISNRVLYLQSLCVLYFISIALGGILLLIRPKIQNIMILCACSMTGNYLIVKAWKIFTIRRSIQKNKYEVVICEKKKLVKMIGMLDTGNTLRDPISGDPVCITDLKNAQKIFGEKTGLGIRYIPFHTIGNSGIIPIRRAEQMMILYNRKVYKIEKPLIGICKEKICTNEEYQIILSRDILGGTKNVCERSN